MRALHACILHNDLKLDKVVLGNTMASSKSIKAYIVDFGKVCKSEHAKTYNLTEEEKGVYKKEHTQVAPN